MSSMSAVKRTYLVAVVVVPTALVRIGQHSVGVVDRLKAARGGVRVAVLVRVVLARHEAVRPLDVRRRGGLLHAEQLVEARLGEVLRERRHSFFFLFFFLLTRGRDETKKDSPHLTPMNCCKVR